jgi:CDP-6-deoxy-D-xylo-4-hexulose-3-dehydrase
MLQNFKDDSLFNSKKAIAKAKTIQNIIPGQNYIPVTGKVLDEGNILLGVDAALDSWLTAGRIANKFEYDFAQYFGPDGQIVFVDICNLLIH